MAQTQTVHTSYSTHDFNSRAPLAGEVAQLNAAWVDVKTPGDGRTYSVGSVVVRTTDSTNGASFSGQGGAIVPQYPIFPNTVNGFTTPTQGASRQVIILQCCAEDPNQPAPNPEQRILWQRYWYGDSLAAGIQPDAWVRRANNPRAISVWPVVDANGELDPVNTRIAIGGESFDRLMQGNQWNGAQGWDLITSQSPIASPFGTNGLANGFVAVFNGNGALLWSYQFYFEGEQGHSAITDISIRVDNTGGTLRDVVTYCGISSFGVRNLIQNADNTLSPVAAFAAPAATVLNPNPASGVTDNGQAQWDGIVGRLSNAHVMPNPAATVREFHSVVGGTEEDGLWGLAEITANRFVVVGGSSIDGNVATPVQGSVTFPYTASPTVAWDSAQFDVGVVMFFDASAVAGGGNLVLDMAEALGTADPSVLTIARDVAISFGNGAGTEEVFIAGATTDSALFPVGLPVTGTLAPFASNGFLLRTQSVPIGALQPIAGAFQNNLGSCGVAIHGEHRDHIAVLGGQGLLAVDSYFRDSATPSNPNLVLLRSDTTGGTGPAFPAAVGAINATTPGRGLAYARGLGGGPNPLSVSAVFNGVQNGGGIAVEPSGRINVAGAVLAAGYPVVPPAPPTLARPYTVFSTSAYANGVRTVVDMLPIAPTGGTGRTDGTGSPAGVAAIFPVAGLDGGTTPVCALAPFGPRIGEPTPPANRMLVDIEGPFGFGASLNVLIDRTPVNTVANLIAFQFGFPSIPALLTGDGLELYMLNNAIIGSYPWAPGQQPLVPGESLRYPVPTLPLSAVTITMQALFFVSTPVPGGVGGNCNTPSSAVVTPAIWITL